MSFNQIKIRLAKLPVGQKIIGVGAFLLILGAVLPWYQDIDKFKVGDMFLGVTGPLYLAGFITLAAGALSLFVIAFKVMGKPLPKLPVMESQLHFVTSALSFFMLVLASSVYFHHKFGINITAKNAGIGMVIAFIGSAGLLFGAIISSKKTVEKDIFADSEMEPLVDMNAEREQSELPKSYNDGKIPTIEEMMANVDALDSQDSNEN